MPGCLTQEHSLSRHLVGRNSVTVPLATRLAEVVVANVRRVPVTVATSQRRHRLQDDLQGAKKQVEPVKNYSQHGWRSKKVIGLLYCVLPG